MRIRLFVPLLAIALMVASCSNPNPADPADRSSGPDQLVLAEGMEPTSLSPLATTYGLAAKFYDGLVALTAEGTVTPDLADGPVRSNDDATQWEATLRKDVTFSDGRAVTADDVAATYRAILDPDTASPLAGTFTMLDRVEADGDTVVFTLSKPYQGFDLLLSVGIAPAGLVSGPVDESALTRAPVGSGPYVLSEWQAGQSMTLTANPDHTPRAEIERVVITFISDQNAILQRAATGEIDGAQLAPALAQTFTDRPGWTVWTNPSADFRAITFPRNDPTFADPRVRRALNLAVNRHQMVDGILFGYGAAASTPFSAGQGEAFNPDTVFAHDPDRAGQLLDEAGWPLEDGVRTKDGQPLTFTVMYFPEDVLRRDLAVAFASDMATIGVTVTVEAVDRPAFTPRIPNDAAMIGGGDMPYHLDQHISALLDGQFATFDPGAPYRNPSGYQNPTVDELLETARTSNDPTTRIEAYREVQATYLTDPAMITLVTLEHTYIVRDVDAWTGLDHVLEPHEHGVSWGPWWNLEQWRRR